MGAGKTEAKPMGTEGASEMATASFPCIKGCGHVETASAYNSFFATLKASTQIAIHNATCHAGTPASMGRKGNKVNLYTFPSSTSSKGKR